MRWCKLRVQRCDMVLVRAIVEASEGVACMHSHSGGELMLVTCVSQAAALDALVRDLREEFHAVVMEWGNTQSASR